MNRFRWWLSDKIQDIAILFDRLAEWVQPELEVGLELEELLTHIEPTDTPFLRSIEER